MEITKVDHKSGQGIYGKSRYIRDRHDWEEAKAIAKEMCEWLDENNGKFKGEHSSAFAMAHAQVCDWKEPWRLFVVDKDLIMPKKLENTKQTLENCFFEHQAIFNAEILEANDKIKKTVPERKINKDPENKLKVEVEVVMTEKEISNIIEVPEGCMSFGHRKPKNMQRFHTIKVRYQYLKKTVLGYTVKTFEGYVSGLKAHIIQHETEHFDGHNIYHKS